MIKRLLFIGWVILISGTAYYLYQQDVTPMMLREYFMMLGPWAFLAYVLAYTLRAVVFFPTSIMTPLSALLFGPVYGWMLTYVGETLSATVAFFIARYFGKDLHLEKTDGSTPGKFAQFILKYKGGLESNGFQTVLFLRLVPLFPFDFVNYGCGLTKIPYRTYLIATLIGVIPGLTAYIFLGGSFMNPYLIIPTILGFIGLSLLARFFKKRWSNV